MKRATTRLAVARPADCIRDAGDRRSPDGPHRFAGIRRTRESPHRACADRAVRCTFAIGDINTCPGNGKLILSGFHEAALVAFVVRKHLNPDARQFLQDTTTSPVMHERLGVSGELEPEAQQDTAEAVSG